MKITNIICELKSNKEILYLKHYTATIYYNIVGQEHSIGADIFVEQTALGKSTTVKIVGEVDYPLTNFITQIKEWVKDNLS